MDKEDFFYCNWYAEGDDVIFGALYQMGANAILVSVPSEMQRYISIHKFFETIMVKPDEV